MVDMIEPFDKRLKDKAKKRIASYNHSRGTVATGDGPLRVLIVPDRLSVAGMVKLYRHMKANPDIVWVNKSNEWTQQYCSVEQWFEWFRDCLTKKIFSKGPQPGKGNRDLRRRRQSVRHKCPVSGSAFVIQYNWRCYDCETQSKKNAQKSA